MSETKETYARLRAELSEALETRDFFANRLNEALGALGYEVPGDTPEGRYRCGLCGPKDAALMDADHEWALWFEKWKAAIDLMGKQAERAEQSLCDVQVLLKAARACLPAFDLMWPPEDSTGSRGRLREALRAAIAEATP